MIMNQIQGKIRYGGGGVPLYLAYPITPPPPGPGLMGQWPTGVCHPSPLLNLHLLLLV